MTVGLFIPLSLYIFICQTSYASQRGIAQLYIAGYVHCGICTLRDVHVGPTRIEILHKQEWTIDLVSGVVSDHVTYHVI